MGVCFATSKEDEYKLIEQLDKSKVQKPLPVLRQELFDSLFFSIRKSNEEKQKLFAKTLLQQDMHQFQKSRKINQEDGSPLHENIFEQEDSNKFNFPSFPKKNVVDVSSFGNKNKQNAIADQQLEAKFQEYFEDHFKIFCMYRFYNSHSKAMKMRKEELELVQQNKITKVMDDEDLFLTPGLSQFNKLGLANNANSFARSSTAKHLMEQQQMLGEVNWIKRKNKYNEDDDIEIIQNMGEENLIVASWINDLGTNQQEFEDKVLFYNNETILLDKPRINHFGQDLPPTTILEHFQNNTEHRRILQERQIEIVCKKGGGFQSFNTDFYLGKKQNQDNLFVVIDAELKIFGVFDGHGEFGHLVSNFASGIMLDYIRNRDKALRHRYLFKDDDSFNEDIRRALRRCFKYTQERLKIIYKSYLAQERAIKKTERNLIFKTAMTAAKQSMERYDQPVQESQEAIDDGLHSSHLNPNNHQRQKKEQTDYLNDGDNLNEDGSLCSESSWDPDENDSLELEIERDEQEEHQQFANKMNKKNQKTQNNDKGNSDLNKSRVTSDSYGEDDLESEEEESKATSEIYQDDQFDSEDDPYLSNQEDELESQKYERKIKKIEQNNKEYLMKLNNQSKSQTEGKNKSHSVEDSTSMSRKVIKMIEKGKQKNLLRENQEKAFQQKLKNLTEEDQKKFDLSLSGCSATIAIQTPSKIYLAWVGDCHALLCKKERKFVNVKLTEDRIIHTPSDKREMMRIYKSRGEVKTGMTLSGDEKPRIYVRGRTFPGLSTSRSLGDLLAHHIGVTSEPSVRIINLSKQQTERFLAIGTDGIWDNMAADDLVENISEHGMKEIGIGSEFVAQKARDFCIGEQRPFSDLTLIISHLKRDDK